MRAGVLALVFALVSRAELDEKAQAVLDRVSEEAEAFLNTAPKVIGKETLQQKAQRTRRRFRLRIGKDARDAPHVGYDVRTIVSEYGFGTLKDAPESLHEFRTVVSVDGRAVSPEGKARESLALGITSEDDRVKRRLLTSFEKHGLKGVALDFGQLVLLFQRRQLGAYQFVPAGTNRLGDEEVTVLKYRQLEGPDSLTVFDGSNTLRVRFEGEIWARAADYLPVRITLRAQQLSGEHEVEHRGTVDYSSSAFAVVLPISVRYEKLVDGHVMVENVAAYSEFKMFSVDAEIKFEPEVSDRTIQK